MSTDTDVSIIIPVTEDYDDIRAVYTEYSGAVGGVTSKFEFIYVIDGHYPEIVTALQSLKEEGAPITTIQFARWFGEATALNAGFNAASGNVVLTLPAYYQVTPEAIPELIRTLEASDVDVVIAARSGGRTSGSRYLQRRAFNWLVSRFAGQTFRDLGCGARAMRKLVTEEMTLYGDQHRFLPILARQVGFRVGEIEVEQHPGCAVRYYYGFGTYIRRLLDVISVLFLSKFTKKPLRFFGLIGTAIAGAGTLVVFILMIQRLFAGVGMADRPALLLGSLLIVLGVQFFAIGLIGELLIFTHAQHIKEFQVRETINLERDDPHS